MPNDYCAYVETFFLRKQKYFNESLAIWKELFLQFSFLFLKFLLAVFSKCSDSLYSKVTACKKGPLVHSKCFKIVKSMKAVHCSWIIFFGIFLGNRFFTNSISDRLEILILSCLKEEEPTDEGWVRIRKLCHLPLIHFISFISLSHIQIFCLNNYSQLTYTKTNLLGQDHLTSKWQREDQNIFLSNCKACIKKTD